jgi:hypothetical protein
VNDVAEFMDDVAELWMIKPSFGQCSRGADDEAKLYIMKPSCGCCSRFTDNVAEI